MPTVERKRRRGSTAEHASFTGAAGEITVDTTKNAVVVHDGSTAGGHPQANEASLAAHIANTSNPHSVTKAQVGLGDVANAAQIPLSYLDTDGTLAADSDEKVPSQKAVKQYVDGAPDNSPAEFIRAVGTGGEAGSNSNAAQPWFPGGNGAVGLEEGKVYRFSGQLMTQKSTGTTSHATRLLFGGTATISIQYFCDAWRATTGAYTHIGPVIAGGEFELFSATASDTEIQIAKVEGVLVCTASGTLIPQFKYSAAPGGAPTILQGTNFQISEVGSAANPFFGPWS